MIARAKLLLPVLALTLAAGSGAAFARPLRPSDLPPSLRGGDWSKPIEIKPVAGSARLGVASYYASRYAGRRAADGSRYDPRAMTAASPSLPLGTTLRVTRLDTGHSVVVTVTDRQAHNGRALDLSRRAAEELGFVRQGTARVRLVALSAVAVEPEEPARHAASRSSRAASARRHGQPHRHPAVRSASAAHRSNPAPSEVLARN